MLVGVETDLLQSGAPLQAGVTAVAPAVVLSSRETQNVFNRSGQTGAVHSLGTSSGLSWRAGRSVVSPRQ